MSHFDRNESVRLSIRKAGQSEPSMKRALRKKEDAELRDRTRAELVQNAARLVEEIERFQTECEDRNETDVGRLWDLTDRAQALLRGVK